MSSIRYEFIMSQIKQIRDIKENEKTKISLVFYEGCQGPCIFKICKNRDLSEVYQALMEVRHPNLTIVYDCVYENGNTYVLEEYILGKTLAEHLKEKGTFTEEETSKVMMALCDGLEVLHRHEPPIIHNDIKTSNIMIREDGIVKLFDFDISRTYKEGSYKNTKLMGTYEYAAPEHYGFGQSEPCTDIYSLGVTMHEMLTGVGLDYDHNVIYHGRMAKLIQKCVEIDRKKRYASAALLKAELEKHQKTNASIWRIIIPCICALFLLFIGGVFVHHYLDTEENPQDLMESEESDSENNSVTEEIETTEDDIVQSEVVENDGNNENNDGMTSSQDKIEGNVANSETIQEEIQPSENPIKIVYNIQDAFLAMDIWADGTYVFLEEISGNYYLRKSDGAEKQLKEVSAALGAQMEYNPYRNQMYLILFDYDESYVYELSQDLEMKLVKEERISGKNTAFLDFFSDGTLVYDGIRYNGDDWTQIGTVAICTSPYVIKDILYSFQTLTNGVENIHRFVQLDATGQIVNSFLFEDAGIDFFDSINRRSMDNNRNVVYFIGSQAGKEYVYCFDGEKIAPVKGLHDHKDYVPFAYDELCVTDTVLRCYSYAHKAIVEILLK